MKILVTGASGYVGSVLVRQLLERGHQVVALLRGERDLPTAVELRIGDLGDPGSLDGIVTDDIDVVVHAATPGEDWDVEKASVAKLLEPLRNSARAFVYLSGVWVLGETAAGNTAGLDESSPLNPIELVARRGEVEAMAVAAAGVRAVVVRPGIVYGQGKGIPAMMVAWARENGVGTFVGTGAEITWPVVHVDDLARLIVASVESASARGVFHAISDPGLPVRALAAAADVCAGGTGQVKAWPESEAAAVLGSGFAAALALHQVVRATRSSELDWAPIEIGLLDDLRSGSYRAGE